MNWNYRKFDGKLYRHKASAKTKSEMKAKQKRWGGRVIPLPKSHPDYVAGYRWGLWQQ